MILVRPYEINGSLGTFPCTSGAGTLGICSIDSGVVRG